MEGKLSWFNNRETGVRKKDAHVVKRSSARGMIVEGEMGGGDREQGDRLK